jgi:hypothetical protein
MIHSRVIAEALERFDEKFDLFPEYELVRKNLETELTTALTSYTEKLRENVLDIIDKQSYLSEDMNFNLGRRHALDQVLALLKEKK